MKATSKALIAALSLSLGAGSLGLAATGTAPVSAPVVQVAEQGDDDGWPMGLFGGHHGRHGKDHARAERGDDDLGGAACAQGAADANGRCAADQNATPPANGLFAPGTAPMAQVN